VIGGWFAGHLLDRWLGTDPWLALVLLLLGTAGAFWETFRIARRVWDEDENGDD